MSLNEIKPQTSAAAMPRDARKSAAPPHREALGGYLILSPLLILMMVGVGAPGLLLVILSVWQQDSYDMVAGWGFGNYAKFFSTPFYLLLLVRSIGIALTVAVASVVLAYPVAYLIAFHVGRHRSLILVLITIPFWTSYLLRIFSWKVVLGYNGVVNSALMGLGITTEPVEALLYNPLAVIITLTHAWMPFVVLPIYVSLAKVPRELLLTAADLGDSALPRFTRIVLPLSMPGVVAAALLVFIPTAGDYVAPMLVGGTGSSMIGTVIAAQFGPGTNWPLASAMSVVTMASVTVTALALMLGMTRIRRRAR